MNETKNVKQEIVITGDNHTGLQHSLGTIFTVATSVKLDAGMNVIADTVEEQITTLKSDKVVVVWGGKNDFGKITPKRP
jgi:hypothetical protein